MLKRMIKFGLLSMFALSSLSAMQMTDVTAKMYIDDEEFTAHTKGDAFHIHIGNNVWLVTNTVHRDATGMFAYECNLSKSLGVGYQMEYERKWKCPYCYNYWPIGKPCGNKDCPSKYK